MLVDTNTRVDELNLDVATNVTGTGDIKNLNVGSAGSVVEQLPDDIYIRPGITADVNGSEMNNATGAESSAEPKLEAGYPKVKNVAPNSATMVFSTNKAGTVYWAVSAVGDGSVSEDNLIEPPAYGGNIFKSGTINAAASKTEYTAQVSGLTTDGSYYVSAILVDSRGNRSPLKVTAFTTPDNTTPAFTTGYPVISMNTTANAQVTVMTNKSCQLYYALLPSGSTAPKPAEFKSNAITGNLGYGTVNMVKNVTQSINVNSERLEELTKYDLYLWLTDYDGAKSSAVRKITFTTPDETPPVITGLEQNLTRTTATAIGVNYTLNEPGKLYWVIYADDATNAFATAYGRDEDDKDKWKGDTVEAKAFVKAGLNSLKKGTSNASKADTDIAFAISGLNSKTTNTTSYMLYVVAEDKAGNLSATVMALNVRTLDTIAPTVKQEFSKVDVDNPNEPEVDTDIRLVFDESVQGDPAKEEKFRELYADVTAAMNSTAPDAATQEANARNALATALQNHITMWRSTTRGDEKVPIRTSGPEGNPAVSIPSDWVVDYRYAKVGMENGNMVITLPTTADKSSDPSALKLTSGTTYWFVLNGIYDEALVPNAMNKENQGAPVKLPEFRVVFAHVSVNNSRNVSIKEVDGVALKAPLPIDFQFTVRPDSVEAVADDMLWDMLIWTDRTMTYELYSRPARDEGEPDNGLDWIKEGSTSVIATGLEDGFVYSSFRKYFQCESGNLTFKSLNMMKEPVENSSDGVKDKDKWPGHGAREYAIRVTKVGNSNVDGVNMRISIVAGYHEGLNLVANGSFASTLEAAKEKYSVDTIGRPNPRNLYKEITDNTPPQLADNYPIIQAGDVSATLDVMLTDPGYVYWVAMPLTPLEYDKAYQSSLPMENQEKYVINYTCDMPPTAKGLGKTWKEVAGTDTTQGQKAGSIVATATVDGVTYGEKSGLPELKEIPTGGPTSDKEGTDANTGRPIITNDKRYYLEAPDSNTVVAMANELQKQGGSRGGMRGGRTERLQRNIKGNTITLPDLNPDTIYLIYIVTANTSGNPEGYEADPECFRFTTKKAVRPTINGINNQTSVLIDVLDTPNADVSYVLVRKGGENVAFSEEFYAHINAKSDLTTVLRNYYGLSTAITLADGDTTADGRLSASGIKKVDDALKAAAGTDKDGKQNPYASYTVLDAMCDPFNNGGYKGSVFDEYATQEAKDKYAPLIRSQTQASTSIVMPLKTERFAQANNGTDKNRINCTGMKQGNQYVLMTVSKSTMGSGDAFRCFFPLEPENSDWPMIEGAGIAVSPTDWDKDNGIIKKGTITLRFSEGLYYQTNDSSGGLDPIKPVCSCRVSVHASDVPQKSVSVMTALTSDGDATATVNTTKTHDASKTPIETITINVTNAYEGSYIMLSKNLCDKDGLGMHRAGLQVTIHVTKDAAGNYSASVEIPKDWDGR